MSKKNYLVTTNYEHEGILLQSFSVLTKKQLKKVQKKLLKHFVEEPILEIRIGLNSTVSLDELSLDEVIDVKELDRDEAQLIVSTFGDELGPLSIDEIYTAVELAKQARKEKVNAE